MQDNLVEKGFYLTSLFVDIKSEHNWTTNETKMALLLFSELSKHKIYLPDLDKFNDSIAELKTRVEKIPLKYSFSKKTFQDVTGVSSAVLAREIKKVSKGLGSKIISTPHPSNPRDNNSILVAPWFSKIEYIDSVGNIELELNHHVLERLVALVRYSKIGFKYIIKLKNHNAIYTYLTIKILLDTSKKKSIKMTVSDYKEKLGLSIKYKALNNFRDKVLEVIKYEINKYTDLKFDYELEKGESGKAFKYIYMTFDYNSEVSDKKDKSKNSISNKPRIIESNSIDDSSYTFEKILIGWNIKARKVIELEENYSLDIIQSAIDKTLEKEKLGEIKTTKAAIFLGILENKQLASDEVFEREQLELAKQQEKELRAKTSVEYDILNSFILSNEDIIKSALTVNSKYLPITDKDAIPVFKKINSIDADKFRGYKMALLSFYHFEGNVTVSSSLSDIVDRSQYIEIEEYKDDMEIIQAYKKALTNIKVNEYITDDQKEILIKEVQDTINILLGF